MSETEELAVCAGDRIYVTVGLRWEAGLYVDGWYGHYSTARALVRAITELGWGEDGCVECEERLTLALFDLSSMGPARAEGSREWLEERLLEEQATALAQRDGWDLGEDLTEILAEELERAEDWLNGQPQTPEGHYWGHSEYGGWGLWEIEEESEVLAHWLWERSVICD